MTDESTTPDDRVDQRIRAQYQAIPKLEPSADIDARILGVAQAEAEAAAADRAEVPAGGARVLRFTRRIPVFVVAAMAASLMLGVGIAMQVSTQFGLPERAAMPAGKNQQLVVESAERAPAMASGGSVDATGCVFPGSADAAPAWVCGAAIPGAVLAAVVSISAGETAENAQVGALDARGREKAMAVLSPEIDRRVAAALDAYVRNVAGVDGAVLGRTLAATRGVVPAGSIQRQAAGGDGTVYLAFALSAAELRALAAATLRTAAGLDPDAWRPVFADENSALVLDRIATMVDVTPAPVDLSAKGNSRKVQPKGIRF